MHEEFPVGFTFEDTAANWPVPTPNSWSTGSVPGYLGVWDDEISEGEPQGGSLSPTPTPPQSPLSGTEVYSGYQQFYVGDYRVDLGNGQGVIQWHFLDHGGYTFGFF